MSHSSATSQWVDDPAKADAHARHRLARFVWGALLGIVLVETGVSFVAHRSAQGDRTFPHDYVSRGIWSAYGLIRPPDSTSTDIAPAITASQRMLSGDHDLYRDFKRARSSYIYPPTTAVELAPFGWIASKWGMGRAVQAMDIVGRLATVALIWVCVQFVRPFSTKRFDWIVCVLIVLAYFPLRWSIFCVQAQTLINAALACAMLAYARSHDRSCGVLIGLASCLKPHFALLVLFALVRRRWRVASSAVLTGVAFVGASLILAGWDAWETYVTQIMPTISDGYAWFANQSFNGMARRWTGESGTFNLIPTTAGIRTFTWCMTALCVILSVTPRFRRHIEPENRSTAHACDFGLAALALTLASPIAWNHHYGWAVALVSACVAMAASSPTIVRPLTMLAVSFVLMATSWSPLAAGAGGIASLVNSKLLFGALLLLVAGWIVCRQPTQATAD